MKSLRYEEMEQINGGAVTVNPNGSCDTEDKNFIRHDLTGIILAVTGGYRKARKIGEMLG
jgi:hypothetical protein